jgi:transposase
MSRIRETKLKNHLSDEQLFHFYEITTEPEHKKRWQMLWLIQHKHIPAIYAAQFVGHAKSWAHYWVHIYNSEGPEGITKKRLRNPKMAEGKVSKAIKSELQAVFQLEFPLEYGGGLWNGPKVQLYLRKKHGIQIHRNTGWRLLCEAGMTVQTCRPEHADSKKEKQAEFKKKLYAKK